MQIKIEIDVTPAELRQFLGLPDVAGLQEDMIAYVRGRVSKGAETFDPADLLRETTTWGNKTLQKFLSMAAGKVAAEEEEEEEQASAARKKRARKRSTSSGTKKS